MPSPFVTAIARGVGGPDVSIGRLVGMQTFQALGADIVGPGFEDTTPTLSVGISGRFGQVGTRQFYWHRDQLYRYNRVANTWVSEGLVFAPAMSSTTQFSHHTGLYFWQDLVTGDFGLMGLYQGPANLVALKYDYLTDAWSFHDSGTSITSGLGGWQGNVVYRNQLFMHDVLSLRTFSFDPTTNAFTLIATGLLSTTQCSQQMIVAENRIFVWKADAASSTPRVHELIGGAWLLTLEFTGSTWSGTVAYRDNGRMFCWHDKPNRRINFMMLHTSNTFFVPRGLLLATNTQASTVANVPAIFTTASALTGTYTNFRFYLCRDQEDVLGTARTYILWAAGASSQTFNVFEFTDGATSWPDLGSSQLSNSMSIPENIQGGSTRIFTVGELWGFVRKVTAAANGVDVTLRFFGDPLFLRHGVVTAGPFTVGETVTGGSSGATGVVTKVYSSEIECATVTGTFVGGETITGGGSGASAILALPHGSVTSGPFQVAETITGSVSGATAVVVALGTGLGDTWLEVSTIGGTPPFQIGDTLTGSVSLATSPLQVPPGNTADKFGRLRYDTEEGPANTIATLADPASGLVSPQTRNVNDFETTRFDGVTDYLLKHETVLDGVPNAAPISYLLEFERP